VQYASSAYVARLQEHGIQISTAERGNPDVHGLLAKQPCELALVR
jgi:hypothetical protein